MIMSEFELAPKYVLAPKEEVSLPLTSLTITLQWMAPVDLDLMAFYSTKDGKNGAVASDALANSPGLGSTTTFPFIQLSGDAGIDEVEGAKQEVLTIAHIDPNVEKINIVAINYSDASRGQAVTFSAYDGLVGVEDPNGVHSFGVPLSSITSGFVSHVATIDNTGSTPKLVRVDEVLTIGQFAETIPGALLILKPSA
jgi:uncharacterized protein involved in tellurium resistance